MIEPPEAVPTTNRLQFFVQFIYPHPHSPVDRTWTIVRAVTVVNVRAVKIKNGAELRGGPLEGAACRVLEPYRA
jgi:hypothetical protein